MYKLLPTDNLSVEGFLSACHSRGSKIDRMVAIQRSKVLKRFTGIVRRSEQARKGLFFLPISNQRGRACQSCLKVKDPFLDKKEL